MKWHGALKTFKTDKCAVFKLHPRQAKNSNVQYKLNGDFLSYTRHKRDILLFLVVVSSNPLFLLFSIITMHIWHVGKPSSITDTCYTHSMKIDSTAQSVPGKTNWNLKRQIIPLVFGVHQRRQNRQETHSKIWELSFKFWITREWHLAFVSLLNVPYNYIIEFIWSAMSSFRKVGAPSSSRWSAVFG